MGNCVNKPKKLKQNQNNKQKAAFSIQNQVSCKIPSSVPPLVVIQRKKQRSMVENTKPSTKPSVGLDINMMAEVNAEFQKFLKQFDQIDDNQNYTLNFSNFYLTQHFNNEPFLDLIFQSQKLFLSNLNLNRSEIKIDQMRSFTSRQWPVLQFLTLNQCKIDDSMIELLLRSQINKVSFLSLNKNFLTDSAIENIALCDLPQLISLNLFQNRIKLKGFKAIVSANWPKLQTLNIGSDIGFEDPQFGYKIEGLDDAFNFPALQYLCLFFNNFSEENFALIPKLKIPKLRNIFMNNGMVSCSKAFEGKQGNVWKEMCLFGISGFQINREQADLGFINIANAFMPKMFHFTLRKFNLSKNAMKHITRAEWPNLTTFVFTQNNLQSESLLPMAKCVWKKLQVLDLSGNAFGVEEIKALSLADWPSLKIFTTKSYLSEFQACTFCMKNPFESLQKLIIMNWNIVVPRVGKDAINFMQF